MKIIILLLALFMVGCYGTSMKPHKTTVTYGKTLTDKPDEDKDVQKDTFTVKQEFLWRE
tara:strand:+ start:123 stop:299 length:177 start_codon:yes stop_codon:yes gene_type:complete